MNESQSLRGFLAMVERDYPEEILRIKVPVRTHLDMTSLVFELEHAGKSPVVVYENVEGHTMPVVTNIAGSRKLLAACLGVAQPDLPSAFRERVQKYIPCETVKEAPWQQVVIEGDQVDFAKLPIPTHFSVDAAPYVTAGQLTARDPLTGVDTTGFHRFMVTGKNRLGVSLHSRRRMYEFHKRAEEKGEPLPAVITLGIHPLHYMGSMVFAYPPHVRKFEIIGGLFGEPYRLAKTGVQDLEVPAGAEIIIEGEILANVHEPEGPFSEFTGYASYRSTQNVFVAHRIRMRRDAMFHSVASGMSQDHILVSCVTREGDPEHAAPQPAQRHRRARAAPDLRRVPRHHQDEEDGAGRAAAGDHGRARHRVLYQVRDRRGRGRRHLRHERRDVGGGHARARRSCSFPAPRVRSSIRPSDPETFTVTKMGIDATKPLGKDFAERLTISDAQRERVRGILHAAGVKL